MIKVGNVYVEWNQAARHQFVLNLCLTCIVLGLATPLSLSMLAGVLESPVILGIGFIMGLLLVTLGLFTFLWGEWIVDHVHLVHLEGGKSDDR